MNTNSRINILPGLMACLGIVAQVLRIILYLFCQDARGLLPGSHILNILVWAITGFAAVLTVLLVWGLDGSLKYADNFSPSGTAAMGDFVLALGICATVFFSWDSYGKLDQLRSIAGVLAVPSLLWIGICRKQGKRPSFLFHALVCLYLTFHAVSHYQTWSSRPQLQDYIFNLSACILLTLFAYYQTAFDVGLGKRRMQLGTGLLGAFACLAAIAGGEDILLYLSGAVWTLTNLCRLDPVPKPQKPIDKPEEPGNAPA